MGTRNLTMVIQNKKPVIAQYGQWDGYYSGQGVVALNFLRECDLERFRETVERCRFIENSKRKQKEIDNFLTKIGAQDGWMNGEQSEKYKKKYPFLTRDNGASILELIYNDESNNLLWLHNSSDFANDSLFCEYAYVVDLDKNTFEVYDGFNRQPLDKGERFYTETPNEGGYYPVRFVYSFDLLKLPIEEEFLETLDSLKIEEE